MLAIAIPRDHLATAFFVTGIAQWTGSELQVTYDDARAPLILTGSPAALSGFDPSTLPTLIIAPHRADVLPMANDVAACVVAFTSSPLRDAVRFDAPFFGLAMNRSTEQIFLMQGSDGDSGAPSSQPTPTKPQS